MYYENFSIASLLIFVLASSSFTIGVFKTLKYTFEIKDLRKVAFFLPLSTVSFFCLIFVIFGLETSATIAGIILALSITLFLSSTVNYSTSKSG